MNSKSPLLSRPGAVEAGGLDAGVASHYGEPLREQRALANGTAVVDLSHRGVVTVSGPDRLSWLNTLSSQQLTQLPPGQSTELLLLSVQGRIEFDARVVDDGGTTWLLVEGAEAAPLAEWLNRMKFMLRVEVADVSAEWAVLGSTRAVEEWSALTVWQDPWPHVTPGGYAYSLVSEDQHPGLERPWFEYLVPAKDLEAAVREIAAAGRQLAGAWAAEALRIAAWRPRWGAETDDRTIPHELDLLRTAVHLSKGCYKGQETIARVHNLGHPPRRLVFLQLDGSQHTLPAAGSEVLAGDRKVGSVTSVSQHYEMGPVALAVIKRSVAADETLTVMDGDEPYTAAQELIVAPDAGQVVGRQTGFLRGTR
ncbi:glycine cleavage T C-terminal barrel domain-containing protein [Pseudarthrobacter sp. J75]|uniref:CAF17-like 4Fe-4S cluster assembly/insertion protein YgfZ n=1 Tax=unclassified Pseudarthrobacter TaxID=2647000 RepID=UPI002E805262|nr:MULTISPECIES: glycine cleavage T C-terminal barrel domain-containing protein [unclassified Pseudarthrobacter]MEE2521122.1 glycine cleavage T C-terminal barrel domain-containing protein [Pseudarthrobacter sp. J47]MEE2528352.1 glycine cleavage T C-terminal barrel domain-containing protein [Pseudarthrobacter sp. J75]